MIFNNEELLQSIDPDCSYQDWITVGMALKADGDSCDTWDAWSSRGSKYVRGECERKWRSFSGTGITKGTLVKMAFDGGFKPFRDPTEEFLEWDDLIDCDGEAPKETKPGSDTIKFLETLFHPDEHVNFVTSARLTDKGKYTPADRGVSALTCGQLIERMKSGDVTDAIGDYNTEAGVWVRINPVDGKGVADENITDFRYALIESDELGLNEQLKKIYELRLPCATIVSSGGKSVHALVRINAKDQETYTREVRFLHDTLKEAGFKVDTANKNPGRLSRLPGVLRGDQRQTLIDVNTGYSDWGTWREYAENKFDEIEFPDVFTFDIYKGKAPEMRPAIIDQILRLNHKMIFSAPPKAGKSWFAIQLAITIAEGRKLFKKFPCMQGDILLVNSEIDPDSFANRIFTSYQAMGIPMTNAHRIHILNLRGVCCTMEQLVRKLSQKIEHETIDMIIIDPVYKFQTGDENAAGDITKFTNQLDRLAQKNNCSIFYTHHYSKGAQSYKSAMDRASGSGVFARDADTLMTSTPLDNTYLRQQEKYQHAKGFRIESVLREFPDLEPFDLIFNFPLFEYDFKGVLKNAQPEDQMMDRQRGGKASQGDDIVNQIFDAFKYVDTTENNGAQLAKVSDIAKFMGRKDDTVRKYVRKFNDRVTGYLLENTKINGENYWRLFKGNSK